VVEAAPKLVADEAGWRMLARAEVGGAWHDTVSWRGAACARCGAAVTRMPS